MVRNTFTGMRLWSIAAFVLLLPLTGTRGQDLHGQDMQALRTDICRCMGALDPEAPDAVFERGFRACLGQAVMRHPSEIRVLLRTSPADGSAGYRLGLAIGEVMGDACPAYVRARDHVRSRPHRTSGQGGT